MKQITIAIHTRMLQKNHLDGIGYFAYHTLQKITTTHPEVQFFFIFDRPYDPSFIFSTNITPIVLSPATKNPLFTYLWYHVRLKSTIKKISPDLFISPDGIIPLGCNTKILSVIHDINFVHYPKDLKFLTSTFYNLFFPRYAREATRIATVSDYSKADLVKQYDLNPSKIDVVYNGADLNFKTLVEESKIATRKKYTNEKEYFIFIGSVHPRKNISRLLQAFDLFKKESGSDMKLVISGRMFWGKSKIQKILQSLTHKNDVIFTGRVDDHELHVLLGSAFCLTYPPYFEGFGVPLIEAMNSEVPIISSHVTSLPEIAGNAALYFDPFSVEEIKNAMQTIYSDTKLRKQLIENGKKQRLHFSWESTAKKLWESIEKTLAQ